MGAIIRKISPPPLISSPISPILESTWSNPPLKYFIFSYNRVYSSKEELAMRFKAFKDNYLEYLSIVKLYKNAKSTVSFGVTKFMDWTKEEKEKVHIFVLKV